MSYYMLILLWLIVTIKKLIPFEALFNFSPFFYFWFIIISVFYYNFIP